MKKRILKIMRSRWLQPLWAWLAHVSRIGMNYWGGAGLYDSGEIGVMVHVRRKLHAQQTPLIFDIGANRGQYTLALAEVFNGNERVYCFEPSRYTFNQLSSTIAKAELDTRVRCFQLGFGEQPENVKLYGQEEGTVIASLYSDSVFVDPDRELIVEEIRLDSIDHFCQNEGIERIDFLKLDVEGHELFALKGARRMLETGRIQFIQFEFGEFHIQARTYFKDFFDLLNPHYDLYRVVANGMVKLDRYDPELEVFLTANYFAEKRSQ